MTHSPRHIIMLQWVVIAVLVLGGGLAFFMLLHKTDEYKTQADSQVGNMASLREQVRQLKNPTPTPGAPLPESTSNGPSPSAGPQISISPRP